MSRIIRAMSLATQSIPNRNFRSFREVVCLPRRMCGFHWNFQFGGLLSISFSIYQATIWPPPDWTMSNPCNLWIINRLACIIDLICVEIGKLRLRQIICSEYFSVNSCSESLVDDGSIEAVSRLEIPVEFPNGNSERRAHCAADARLLADD